MDFDNTITTRDVLDDMMERFSATDRWKTLEQDWRDKKISTLECLREQIQDLHISRAALADYCRSIEIDRYFKPLLALLKSHNVQTIILSDNFDIIILEILKNNNIHDIKIFSNALSFGQNRLIPRFPLASSKCANCAHCKKETLLANTSEDQTTVYVGDGQSDVCPAKEANIVFAKAPLAAYLRAYGKESIDFRTLKDVHDYFSTNLL